MRQLAWAYAIVVALVTGYAWFVDIALRQSRREHLLGDVLLFFVSLPSSLSVNVFYDRWTAAATRPFSQLIWISLCALVQVAVLFVVTRWIKRLSLPPNERQR